MGLQRSRRPEKKRAFIAECELTKFYGIDAFALPDAVKLALEVNRPALEARESLKGPVADDRLFDLVLLATGSEDAAAEALSARIGERLRKSEQVDI